MGGIHEVVPWTYAISRVNAGEGMHRLEGTYACVGGWVDVQGRVGCRVRGPANGPMLRAHAYGLGLACLG